MALLRTCDRCGNEIVKKSDLTNLVNSISAQSDDIAKSLVDAKRFKKGCGSKVKGEDK